MPEDEVDAAFLAVLAGVLGPRGGALRCASKDA